MSEPFIGQITMFAGNFAPRGWALCDGQLLSIAQNSALFSILGTTYGGDGRTTFGLPEMRGRVPIHSGTGPGLSSRPLGQRSGEQSVTLTTSQMPNHGHNVVVPSSSNQGTSGSPNGNIPAADTFGFTADYAGSSAANGELAISQANSGGGQSHNNMQPYLVINFIIALVGIFPSRN